jgi:hypothetical protein
MDLFEIRRGLSLQEASELVLQRVGPLEDLIAQAYRDRSGDAWRQYQVGMHRLHTAYATPWEEEWASQGLRRQAYLIEDRHLPYASVPTGLKTTAAFIDHAQNLLPSITSMRSPLIRFLLDKEPTKDQWRIYAASMYGRGKVHHANLARLALQTKEERHACFVYRMLGDEGGQGDYNKAHSTLILPFLEHVGGNASESDKVATLFEAKVLYNWMQRVFMHPNPLWSIATIYYLENQASMEFTALLPRLRKAGFPESVLPFFVIHGDDPETELHNNMCKKVLEAYVHNDNDMKVALTAMVRAGDLFDSLFLAVAKLMDVKV